MLSKTTLVLAVALAAGRADARAYAQRCEAYNSQANPDYGFGPCIIVRPDDVVVGTPSRPHLYPRRLNGSPR